MYKDFAYIYDELTKDIDYTKWANYISSIIKENSKDANLICELGCGTGSFAVEMSKLDYDMIGIDLSPEMLMCAKEKSLKENKEILFVNQDMTEFELYDKVDVILCLLDSINYITDKRNLKKVFKLVNKYLNDDGIFIFDINTVHKLKNILGNNIFYEIQDEISYIWENRYDSKKKICEFDLTFFKKNGELFERFDEIHRERAYSIQELKNLLGEAKLKVISIFDELTFKKHKSNSERIFFVCKKC